MSAILDRETLMQGWQAGPDRGALEAVVGGNVAEVQLERVHFPGKRAVQLVYAVRLGAGGTASVLAEHHADGCETAAELARASLRKSRNGQRAGLTSGAIVVDPKSGLVLRRPGLDERLPGLRALYDSTFAREIVTSLTGRDPGPVSTTLMAHRLGKRAVIRIEACETVFYARMRAIKSGDGEARLARHRAVWAAREAHMALALPEPLGALPEIGLSLFAALPGQAPDFRHDAHAVAAALDALRNLNIPGLPHHTGAHEARLLLGWHARCHRYRPALAQHVDPVLDRICAELTGTQGPTHSCHRDLHEKQILVAQGRAGFLDFDTLCVAHPALDPGNLLAHLFFSGHNEAPLQRACDMPGLSLWRRAALLRLAMIYSFTATPQAAIQRLIHEASV